MLPDYHDVTSRITEEPSWYTIDGYPRYGEFKPGECDIYCRYSILFLIQCQSCEKPFLIGYDFDHYNDEIRWLVDDKQGGESWVPVNISIFATCKQNENGEDIIRRLTFEDMINFFGMGDPPNHACIGSTMGSIERGAVQAWDRMFGRTTESHPSPNGGEYQTIINWGKPARIKELEYVERPVKWMTVEQQAALPNIIDLVPEEMR